MLKNCPEGFSRPELVLLAKENGVQITRKSPLKGAKNMKELCDELKKIKTVRRASLKPTKPITEDCPKGFTRPELVLLAKENGIQITRKSPSKGAKNMKELCDELNKSRKRDVKRIVRKSTSRTAVKKLSSNLREQLVLLPSLSSSSSSSSSSSQQSSESLIDAPEEYTKSTFTLTYGNRAENHRGMQIIGQKLDHGLSIKDLENAQKYFDKKGAKTLMVDLIDCLSEKDAKIVRDSGVEAKILIVKKGVDYIVNADKLYREVERTPKDSKAFMYGKVVNKHARHNNVFSDFTQSPDYAQGKGTIINFKDVPLISKIRKEMPKIIPKNAGVVGLQCEGNYYYDVEKTFIGFHGDTEREIVIAVRLGADFNMYYQWYKDNKPIGKLFTYKMGHGDMYFMSEKAVGNDWKRKTQYTLRHAAAKNPKLVKL
jgi:hypothetical protein